MSESNRNPKTFHEGKIKNPSPVHVSLDNADTVIEGGSRNPASCAQTQAS